VYSGPISVAASETVKAIAIASGGSASAAGAAAYTITLQAPMPAFSVAPGTYSTPQSVSITSAVPSATVHYTTNGATPTTSSPICSGPIMVAATETVKAVAVATGYSPSSVNTASYTISAPTNNTPPPATTTFSPASGTYTSTQTVSISTTASRATIYYTTNGSTPTTRSSVYTRPITVGATETIKAITIVKGQSEDGVTSATYTINLAQAEAPIFSPAAGTYSSAQTVTISTTMPSATIFYTTNGKTPTTSSPMYSGPIVVSATETIKAIAVSLDAAEIKSTSRGSNNSSTSPVGSAAYTVKALTASFGVALLPSAFTVTPGQSGTATIEVTPVNGYSSAVSFSCSGLPAGASCRFSPSSVTPSGAVATTTLTIATAAENTALNHSSSTSLPTSAMALAFCCFGWKRRRGARILMLAGIAGAGLSICTGCGSNVFTLPGTTSTVTLIATDGSLQPTTTFSLTLQ
jgi:hypothetical protein